MTIHDYVMTMKSPAEKTVKVAVLKAQLSAYLRAARRGHSVVVCERDTPVARLMPYTERGDALTSRLPTRRWGSMKRSAPLGRSVDSLAALLEERESSR